MRRCSKRTSPWTLCRRIGDLSKYKLVLAPMQLLMVDAEAAAQMKRYVAQGGSLMTTFRCGAKNSENVCHGEGALPHDLTDLFGCELEDFTCLNQNTPLTLNGRTVIAHPARFGRMN